MVDTDETIINKWTYFTSLQMANVKCFGEHQELKLTDDKGHPASWTLILGNNGVGKTTLLQCLARMRPVPATSEDDTEPDKIEPELNREESNEVLDRFIRVGDNVALTLEANLSADSRLGRSAKNKKEFKTCLQLDRKNTEFEEKRIDGSTVNIKIKTEPCILGYGATRRTGSLDPESADSRDTVASLFDNHVDLYDAEAILYRLDHAAARKRPRAGERLKSLKQALTDILPDIERARDINILGPKISDSPEEKSGVLIKTPYATVPLSQLSLGTQTALALTVDIAWRMLRQYPSSKNCLAEPAIVLIDEIDLHLHPRWQREIRTSLTAHFPNVQFIATAHSPLMAQTALEENLVVLRKEGDHVVIENDPAVVDDWRIDQIVTSELYDYMSARPPKIERLIEEREWILDKTRQTKGEKARLEEIEKQLEKLPTAERREDQEAMEIIRKAAAFLKGNG